MKTAMEAQVKVFDFSHYATMSLAVYLLIGFMITVVQSSDHGSYTECSSC
jgi:phosphate:Na+ symporter